MCFSNERIKCYWKLRKHLNACCSEEGINGLWAKSQQQVQNFWICAFKKLAIRILYRNNNIKVIILRQRNVCVL